MSQAVQIAEDLGVVYSGWHFVDYSREAVNHRKWICAIIWGEKGTYKSNTLLQHGYAMFHAPDVQEEIGKDEATNEPIYRGVIKDWNDSQAWKSVLEHTVFRPQHFKALVKDAMDKKERIAWVGWDDINIHLPRSMYSTQRNFWQEIARNWEGFRARLSVFECTAPRKDNVVSFILKDMNWDILNTGRQISDVRNWRWYRDFSEPMRVLSTSIKIDEDRLEPHHVPDDVWAEYEERKNQIIDTESEGLIKTMDEIDKPRLGDKKHSAIVTCEGCGKLMNEWNYKTHKCRGKIAPPPSP